MKRFKTQNGYDIIRLSGWLKIHTSIVTQRHSLAMYGGETTEDGKLSVDWIQFRGNKYPLRRFERCYPIMFDDEEGKLSHLSGYDVENFYNPIMIELNYDGEPYVRIYQQDTSKEKRK